MSRKRAREFAMKIIYEMDVKEDFSNILLQKALSYYKLQLDEEKYISTLIDHFKENEEAINSIIESFLTKWTLQRIARIDRAILRIATTEIYYMDIPESVAINEAVELAKAYSTEETYRYINGVLGNIVKEKGKSDE